MNIKDLLQRIDAKAKPLGLTDTQLSLMAGGRDLVRNWRRAAAQGKDTGTRTGSLEGIAKGLGVTLEWLTTGYSEERTAVQSNGFSEAATPYEIANFPIKDDDPQRALRSIYGPAATTPATFKLTMSLPAFALVANDVLVVDLARVPSPGDLTLVTILDEATTETQTVIRRYLPPYLAGGTLIDTDKPMRTDQFGVTVRYPVVGIMRGLP